MRGRIGAGAILAFGLLAACGQQASDGTPAPTPASTVTASSAVTEPAEAVLTAIQETKKQQLAALEAGDTVGGTAVYAPDAVFYEPGKPPVTGDQIRAAFERIGEDAAYDLTIDEASRTHWVAKNGDLAVTSYTGRWTHTKSDHVVTTEPLVNQTVWKLQPDGAWKIVSDVNAVIAEPAPA